MAQSDLEKFGTTKRHDDQVKYDTYSRSEDYSKDDSYHIYEGDGDLHGKGTEAKDNPQDIALSLGAIEEKLDYKNHLYGKTLNTDNGGGEYDRKGYGALEGKSGRNYLVGTSALNKYKPGTEEYGETSVTINVPKEEGQYIVE